MIVRPTTEQLLLDCCKELMQGVLPAVSDQTAVVRIFMIEQVLRNAAVRCAHEIAWMDEEIPVIDSYARAVLQVAPRDELVALLRRLNEAETGLDLDTLSTATAGPGTCWPAALEIAVTDGLTDLRQRGEQLLDARHARENVVLAGWSPTGR